MAWNSRILGSFAKTFPSIICLLYKYTNSGNMILEILMIRFSLLQTVKSEIIESIDRAIDILHEHARKHGGPMTPEERQSLQ